MMENNKVSINDESSSSASLAFKMIVAPPKRPMPDHLKMRLQSYKQKRIPPSSQALQDKLRAATRRRQKCLERRAENARETDARCQRLVEAFNMMQDQCDAKRRLKAGDQNVQAPYKNYQMQEVLDNIKDDLQILFSRLGRDVSRSEESPLFQRPVIFSNLDCFATTINELPVQRIHNMSISNDNDNDDDDDDDDKANEHNSRSSTPVNLDGLNNHAEKPPQPSAAPPAPAQQAPSLVNAETQTGPYECQHCHAFV